ncbi:hypothetical protein HanIR_Chr14g0678771 [Helianthus annuus]|nr:hypothetical protein HanIR_Chr14g0678771 [Helianthus annuus]
MAASDVTYLVALRQKPYIRASDWFIGNASELPEIGRNPSFLTEPARSRQPVESSENTIPAIGCWYW